MITESVLATAEAIPGWFSRADMQSYAALAACYVRPGGLAVEVGCWQGRSTVILAAVCQKIGATVLCVDTWRGYPPDHTAPNRAVLAEAERNPHAILGAFLRHTAPYEDTIGLYVGDSRHAAGGLEPESVDLVFLDADHDSPGFDADVENFWSAVRPGGCLAGHDYHNVDYPDVTRVVDGRFDGYERWVQMFPGFPDVDLEAVAGLEVRRPAATAPRGSWAGWLMGWPDLIWAVEKA